MVEKGEEVKKDKQIQKILRTCQCQGQHHKNKCHCSLNQESYSTSSECFVKGWGKDVFGKDGQYQVCITITIRFAGWNHGGV